MITRRDSYKWKIRVAYYSFFCILASQIMLIGAFGDNKLFFSTTRSFLDWVALVVDQIIYCKPYFAMFVTNTQKFFLTLLFLPLVFHGQIFKTASGDLEAISGVQRYNVVFEYDKNLKIPKHTSEKAFLEIESKKRNANNPGSGDAFKENWYAYRKSIFEPKFIQEFNFFDLKEKKVTVAANVSDAAYTMVVKTLLIDPGNSNFVFKKEARIEAIVTIYKTENQHTVVYSTTTISIRSEGAKPDDLERIMSAYGELGRALSKHFSRKT